MDLKDLKRIFNTALNDIDNLWRALWHRKYKTGNWTSAEKNWKIRFLEW